MKYQEKLVFCSFLILLLLLACFYRSAARSDGVTAEIKPLTEHAISHSKALTELERQSFRLLNACNVTLVRAMDGDAAGAAEAREIGDTEKPLDQALGSYRALVMESFEKSHAAILQEHRNAFVSQCAGLRGAAERGDLLELQRRSDRLKQEQALLVREIEAALHSERKHLESVAGVLTASMNRANEEQLILLTVMVVGIFACCSIYIAPVLRRISLLSDAVQRIAPGELVEVPDAPSNAAGSRCAAFNQMSQSLKGSQHGPLSPRADLDDLLHSLTDAVIVVDECCTVKLINQAALRMLDLQPLDSKRLPELPAGASEGIRSVAEGRAPEFSLEYPADGNGERWLRLSAMPLRNGSGGAVICLRDVSHLRELALELQKTLQLQKNLSRQVPGVLYQYRLLPDGKSYFPYVSEACRELLGISPELLRQDAGPVIRSIHRADRKPLLDSCHESLSSLSPVWRHDFRFILPGKSVRWLRSESRMQQLADGSFLWHGFVSDISEQKLIPEELQLSRCIRQQTPDPFYLLSPTGKFVLVNQAESDLFGYTDHELLSLTVQDINPSINGREGWRELFLKLKRQGSLRYETAHRKKDGSYVPVELTASYLFFRGKHYACAIARDISERKQAERMLQESEVRYRTIFEASPTGMWLTDFSGRILAANPAMLTITGHSWEDLQQMSIQDLYLDQSQRKRLVRRVRKSGRVRSAEVLLKRKDGTIMTGNLSIEQLDLLGDKVLLTNLQDVTLEKLLEEKLRTMHNELETRVAQRTADLKAANDRLTALNISIREEMEQRIEAESRLTTSRNEIATLAAELNLSEERGRRRIANVLHDNVVQDLALGKLKLDMALKQNAVSPEFLSSLASLLEKAMKDIRSLCLDLSPPCLYDLGLPQAIENLGDRLSVEHGFNFHFQDSGTPVPLRQEILIVLYQAAREFLINAVKHARAENVRVQIRHKLGIIQLTVVDDGIGFSSVHNTKGFGLASLRQRIDHLNGTMRIISHPGKKTVISVAVPKDPPFSAPDHATPPSSLPEAESGVAAHTPGTTA